MYKLLAIDLDGTLFNAYGEVTKGNKEALKYAMNKGVEVILASGRDPYAMKKISIDLGIKNFLIAGNGANIYSIKDDEIIYEKYIEKEKVLKIIKICKENSIFANIYTNKGIIAESLNYNVKVFNSENNYKPTQKQTNIEIVKDIYEYINNTDLHVLKIIICDEDKIIFENIIQKLKRISGVEVLDIEHMSKKVIRIGTEEINIEYFYTEITKAGTDKWNAIEFLIKKLKIKKDEVICIGDNLNDKKMVENASVGITMKNSALDKKNIGDYVTKDNNSDGVKYAIYKYI